MRSTILGLALLAAAASPAVAQRTNKAKAKALYERGLKHYNLAEYPDAIKAWKEAYSLSKKPLLLFNIGQAYRLAGDCKLAVTFYDSYQREEPNPRNQDELDTALGLCAKAADAPADKQRVSDKAPVEARATDAVPDKRPIDRAPIADKPRPDPSDDTSDDTSDDAEVAKDESEQGDGPEDMSVTTTGGGMRKAGIAVGVAGAVLGGVGVYFALDSASASSSLEGYAGEWGQEQINIEARGERSAKLGWVMGGLGIVGIVAGGVMIAIGGPKSVETSDVAVVPTRGGAAVSWALRF